MGHASYRWTMSGRKAVHVQPGKEWPSGLSSPWIGDVHPTWHPGSTCTTLTEKRKAAHRQLGKRWQDVFRALPLSYTPVVGAEGFEPPTSSSKWM